jgi:hypothetical protein
VTAKTNYNFLNHPHYTTKDWMRLKRRKNGENIKFCYREMKMMDYMDNETKDLSLKNSLQGYLMRKL